MLLTYNFSCCCTGAFGCAVFLVIGVDGFKSVSSCVNGSRSMGCSNISAVLWGWERDPTGPNGASSESATSFTPGNLIMPEEKNPRVFSPT